MTIGESMRAARKKAGLTQKQLAEKSGITQPTISVIEQGKYCPRLLTTIDMADALGITVDEYIGHSVKKEPAPKTVMVESVFTVENAINKNLLSEVESVPAIANATTKNLPSKTELFKDRVRYLLYQRQIPIYKFQEDTGIDRTNFFYKRDAHKHCRYIHMAIAYYFGMDVEELIAGTDAEIDWYGDYGI